MDKRIKKKWIAALRSGKYRQAEGVLRMGCRRGGHARYCCLGVLCEVVGAHRISSSTYEYDGVASSFALPFPLVKKLKITHEERDHLVEMNDNGKPFHTIANWIEENL